MSVVEIWLLTIAVFFGAVLTGCILYSWFMKHYLVSEMDDSGMHPRGFIRAMSVNHAIKKLKLKKWSPHSFLLEDKQGNSFSIDPLISLSGYDDLPHAKRSVTPPKSATVTPGPLPDLIFGYRRNFR